MFGTINKRRNPNKHWGGWKKIQSLENLGEVCLALKRILKCKFCLCLVKKKNSLEFFFLYNEKNFPQKIIDFTVWLFSSNKSSSTKQSVNQLI